MIFNRITLFSLLLSIPFSIGFGWETYSTYDHFTKRLAPGLFTGGWLTTREIAYLNAAGFKSILSTTEISSGAAVNNGVVGEFPSSTEEVEYAQSLGMTATYIAATFDTESVELVSSTIHELPKPVFIHCHSGYGATLFVQLHMYLAGVVDGDDIYNNSLTLGYDYQSNADAVNLIYEVTGVAAEVMPPSIEQTLTNGESSYTYYYWAHRMTNDYWYNIGQVLDTQVDAIKSAGYKTVISFRATGESTNYLPGETPENTNNHEFSDSDGLYNATKEQLAFEAVGLHFYNLPVTGADAWSASTLAAYAPSMTEALSYGPVLVHCRSGYRSSAYTAAYLAQQQGQCTPWAVQQARRVGDSFDILASDASVMQFFEDSLGC